MSDAMRDDDMFVLVIDTNKYAGNFERDMCAYMTGRIGQCTVGEKEARKFYLEMGLVKKDSDMDNMSLEWSSEDLQNPFDFIAKMADDHGCFRPCAAVPTIGTSEYNSVGIYMDRMPTDSEMKLLAERAVKYAEEHKIEIKMFRVIHRETKHHQVLQWARNSAVTS